MDDGKDLSTDIFNKAETVLLLRGNRDDYSTKAIENI
jgi:hypothetical protein